MQFNARILTFCEVVFISAAYCKANFFLNVCGFQLQLVKRPQPESFDAPEC
jgi:hypothetical protein